MENIWNQRHLIPSPIFTLKCQKTIKLGNLKSICKDLEELLNKNELLNTEAAMLSRMIYRVHNKFRSDKGFQNMRKVKRCLQRYLEMDAVSQVRNFSSCLPDEQCSSLSYLPSRQMLQCLLVRLMGLGRLMHQAGNFCKDAARFTIPRIQIGHSWSLATLLLAIIARIWSLCERLVWSVCLMYRDLLAFEPQLPAADVAWLPPLFSFPQDLALWLGAEKPGSHSSAAQMSNHGSLVSDKIFGLLGEEEEEDVSESAAIVGTKIFVPAPTPKAFKQAAPAIPATMYSNEEDLGESLSFAEDTSDLSELKRKISTINSLEDLIRFTRKELSKNTENNISVRKQLKGVVKALKKSEKLNNKKQMVNLLQKAKYILVSNHL